MVARDRVAIRPSALAMIERLAAEKFRAGEGLQIPRGGPAALSHPRIQIHLLSSPSFGELTRTLGE
jgi:hypothetical protein